MYTIFPLSQINAAGVSVTLDTTDRNTSASVTHDLNFTPNTVLQNGDTITVTWNSSYTDSSLTNTDFTVTKAGDANFTSAAAVVNAANDRVVFTLTTGGNLDTSNQFDITVGGVNFLVTPATAGNYAFYVVTSASAGGGDYGAAMEYVGDDNDVNVTAMVNPNLTFSIRNSSDVSDTNACDLGVLALAAVQTCQYRLKVSTNAESGYTVQIDSDGGLVNAGAASIDPITEDTTVTAGAEGYGVAFVGGSSSEGGVSITETPDYDDDDTPIPASSTQIYASDGPNNPGSTDTVNTALVTHRAAIDGATESGYYTQVVTYTVTASF